MHAGTVGNAFAETGRAVDIQMFMFTVRYFVLALFFSLVVGLIVR